MSPKPIAVVTGGAGFIGSHMVDRLVSSGFEVRVIDNLVGGREANLAHHRSNADVSLEHADIRSLEPNSSLFKDVRYVFHFAGIGDIVPSIEHPAEYMSTNVQGTVSVLECAREAHVEKLVYAASSSCYGLAAVPTGEDHLIHPKYPYALSKYQGGGLLSLASGLWPSCQLHPHFQCLWDPFSNIGCLWSSVWRVSAPEIGGETFYCCRRWKSDT